MSLIGWYSLDKNTDTVDHDPVSLEAALEIAKKYYANADKKWEAAEEGLADTMFGFTRDKSTFIELCVNGPAEISCRFEMPKKPEARFFKGVFQRESTLTSWAEIEKAITDFYTLEPMQLRDRRSAPR